MVPVDNDKERLEPPKDAVATPVLRQLDRGAGHVLGISLELLLELFEKAHPVGCRTGESGEKLSTSDGTHLMSV